MEAVKQQRTAGEGCPALNPVYDHCPYEIIGAYDRKGKNKALITDFVWSITELLFSRKYPHRAYPSMVVNSAESPYLSLDRLKGESAERKPLFLHFFAAIGVVSIQHIQRI